MLSVLLGCFNSVSPLSGTLLSLGLHPIVLVSGYATNMLDAHLMEIYQPSSLRCGERKGKGWFRLYLNYSAL
jgi:hypothetical protein